MIFWKKFEVGTYLGGYCALGAMVSNPADIKSYTTTSANNLW